MTLIYSTQGPTFSNRVRGYSFSSGLCEVEPSAVGMFLSLGDFRVVDGIVVNTKNVQWFLKDGFWEPIFLAPAAKKELPKLTIDFNNLPEALPDEYMKLLSLYTKGGKLK